MGSTQTETTELGAPELNVLVGEFLGVQRLEMLDRRLVIRQLISGVLRVLGQFQVDVS